MQSTKDKGQSPLLNHAALRSFDEPDEFIYFPGVLDLRANPFERLPRVQFGRQQKMKGVVQRSNRFARVTAPLHANFV
jgi:hypothetical protein